MNSPFSLSVFSTRQARLRSEIAARRLGLVLVTHPVNIFYLTGFRGSAGAAVFGSTEAVLWVDPRYTLQARSDAHGVEVIETKTGILKALGRWLRKHKFKRVGYDDVHLTCAELDMLARESGTRRGLVPAGGVLEGLRAVKDSDEIALIRRAAELTSAVFESVLGKVRPGVLEADLAAEVEYRMRLEGAEGAAFETIVASGPRGAWPHARASRKPLEPGELVIFDLGAILSGYAADMTRTVYLGDAGRRVRRLYAAVLEAETAAIECLHAGVRAADVDAAARRALTRRGLGQFFTHSTGHGVGLEVHERPRLGRRSKDSIPAGSVVTTEPGVYLEGFGGIRIEDTVLVTDSGVEALTRASKNWGRMTVGGAGHGG